MQMDRREQQIALARVDWLAIDRERNRRARAWNEALEQPRVFRIGHVTLLAPPRHRECRPRAVPSQSPAELERFPRRPRSRAGSAYEIRSRTAATPGSATRPIKPPGVTAFRRGSKASRQSALAYKDARRHEMSPPRSPPRRSGRDTSRRRVRRDDEPRAGRG